MSPTRDDRRRGASGATSGPAGQLVAVVGLAGLLLGALVGGFLGSAQERQWTATALLQISPDPQVSTTGVTSTPTDSQVSSFVQTQLIYLGSDGFVRQVEQELGGEVDVRTTQVQEAPVVQVTGTDPSPDRASAVVSQVVQDYTAYRTQSLQAALAAQADAAAQQLTQVQDQLGQLPPTSQDDESSAVAVQREALQGDYSALLAQSRAIATAQRSSAGVVQTLQGVETTPPAGLPPAAVGLVAGGALGALLGVGAVVVLRRLSPRIGGTVDLERYGVPVLAPEVPHVRSSGDLVGGPVQRVVAAQAPHLERGRTGAPEIALVGAAPGVGTSFLALHHAVYAARRGPVVLVRVAGEDDAEAARLLGVTSTTTAQDAGGERTSASDLERWAVATAVPGLALIGFGPDAGTGTALLEDALAAGLVDACRATGWGVVVDAPSLEGSTAGLVASRACGSAGLVVATGVTTRTEVEQALDAFAAWDEVPSAVILNRPARRGQAAAALVPHGAHGFGGEGAAR